MRANLIWTFLFFILLLLVFGLPGRQVAVVRDRVITDRCNYGDRLVDSVNAELKKDRPLLILVGNSILGEGIDQEKLSSTLGIQSAKVWYGGQMSAWWFLLIKNIVARLDYTPRYIGIVVRDNFLTVPNHRVTGKHMKAIDDFAGPDEDLLDRLAYLNSMSPVERMLHLYLPVYNRRDTLKDQAEDNLRRLTASVLRRKGTDDIIDSFEAVFANRKMNTHLLNEREVADDLKRDRLLQDINFNPESSFLPSIISICREKGISLFVVRAKRRRDLNPDAEPPGLKDYVEKLRRYLSEHDVAFFDFTTEATITMEHFGNGDHLNRGEGRAYFTKLLAKKLQNEMIDGTKGGN